MFYSQFILAKKGPLGTIWIAAHLERKLRKNQVADTDIGVSVDSILFPDVPIALRLSSHLLLGVVRIYSRKVNYLFDDCSDALLKIKQAFRSTAVDLPPEESTAPYHSITLPETFDLEDFEIPDSDIFHGNYVDQHVSTKEQITLQESVDGAAFASNKFGLDERFGDGDASHVALDFEEDVFLEKGASRFEDTVENDSVIPDSPAIFGGSVIFPGITPEVDDYAQAPSTPGLVKEPNIITVQEGLACDDHFEGEDQNNSMKLSNVDEPDLSPVHCADRAKDATSEASVLGSGVDEMTGNCEEFLDINVAMDADVKTPESLRVLRSGEGTSLANVEKELSESEPVFRSCSSYSGKEQADNLVERTPLPESENVSDEQLTSEVSAPEKLLSDPFVSLPVQPVSLIDECTPEIAAEFDEIETRSKASAKRSFLDSMRTSEFQETVPISSVDSIPKDDDLLSSILAGRRSSLRVKPSPATTEKNSRKRVRYTPRTSNVKRKVLVDDAMVLLGETIRQQLTNTEDIRRVRKKAPCTRAEVAVIQRQFLEEEIFSDALFSGTASDLRQLHSEKLDLSEVRIIDVGCDEVSKAPSAGEFCEHPGLREGYRCEDEVLMEDVDCHADLVHAILDAGEVECESPARKLESERFQDVASETPAVANDLPRNDEAPPDLDDSVNNATSLPERRGDRESKLGSEISFANAIPESAMTMSAEYGNEEKASLDENHVKPYGEEDEAILRNAHDTLRAESAFGGDGGCTSINHDENVEGPTIPHNTEFLTFDDDDDVAEDDADDSGPLDNSGWSSRTRAVANYLQTLFDKEAGYGKNVLSVDNLLTGKSSKEASRMFFETLVLKTKDYIQVEQGNPYDFISIKPRSKLMKSEF